MLTPLRSLAVRRQGTTHGRSLCRSCSFSACLASASARPGLLPLPGLRFCLCFPLLGPALGLQCLVAHECTVGLLGLALSLVHLPASFPRGSVGLDTREDQGGYTRGPMRGARNGRPRLVPSGPPRGERPA